MASFLKKIDDLLDSRLKMNDVWREVREDRRVWVKRRRRSSGCIIAATNLFFALTGARSRFCFMKEWQQWEVESFRQLYGDELSAGAAGKDMVWIEEVPGISLCDALRAGQLTETMLRATGRELCRAHQIYSRHFKGGWSHGDLILENVLYDVASNRARLIDFETIHHRALAADERHADDLLVLLLDLAGQSSSEVWANSATHLIDAYDRPEVLRVLKRQLVRPQGLAQVWWMFRTSYLSGAELEQRLELLRERLP